MLQLLSQPRLVWTLHSRLHLQHLQQVDLSQNQQNWQKGWWRLLQQQQGPELLLWLLPLEG
jgi:hypothetical protein